MPVLRRPVEPAGKNGFRRNGRFWREAGIQFHNAYLRIRNNRRA